MDLVRIGKTVILGTVVSARKASPVDFTLNGRLSRKICCSRTFPGGFFKEKQDQVIRSINNAFSRPCLRPLFPSDYHAEVQVMIQLMSHDDDVMPALAGLAASAALALSDIPFATLIQKYRRKVYHQSKPCTIRIIRHRYDGASMDSIAMVEGEMKEISEAEMLEAIKFAHEHIKIQFLLNCVYKLLLERKKFVPTTEKEKKAIHAKVKAASYDKIYAVAKAGSAKHERSAAFAEIKEEVKALFTEEELAENGDLISRYFSKTNKEAVRNVTLDLGTRLDGRKTTEIRPIWAEIDYYLQFTDLPYLLEEKLKHWQQLL
jgi:polyribonucleotide nucleotidyltransferase